MHLSRAALRNSPQNLTLNNFADVNQESDVSERGNRREIFNENRTEITFCRRCWHKGFRLLQYIVVT